VRIPSDNGIVADKVEETIQNIGSVCRMMATADREIVTIMRRKAPRHSRGSSAAALERAKSESSRPQADSDALGLAMLLVASPAPFWACGAARALPLLRGGAFTTRLPLGSFMFGNIVIQALATI